MMTKGSFITQKKYLQSDFSRVSEALTTPFFSFTIQEGQPIRMLIHLYSLASSLLSRLLSSGSAARLCCWSTRSAQVGLECILLMWVAGLEPNSFECMLFGHNRLENRPLLGHMYFFSEGGNGSRETLLPWLISPILCSCPSIVLAYPLLVLPQISIHFLLPLLLISGAISFVYPKEPFGLVYSPTPNV